MAPAKARIGLPHYRKAWRGAVALFGPNQVSSFLIAGLGEPAASHLQGSEWLADLGVYPFLVPLRPISGSGSGLALPPPADVMRPLYEAVADLLARKGLSAAACKAGCVSCGACSALAAYEGPATEIVYHPTRTPREIAAAMAIRRDGFVVEQGLFSDTDADEHDAVSIHIIAKTDGTVAGTVRVYPVNDNGDWVGGRLAVHQRFRSSDVGAGLVEEAVNKVQRLGCKRFTAHIQEQNVRFSPANPTDAPADQLRAVIDQVRCYPDVLRKKPIQDGYNILSQTHFYGSLLPNFCDDAAVVPWYDGFLLLAADGMMTRLLVKEPYAAGKAAVMVTVNDIYAMGGRPIGLVNVLASGNAQQRAQIVAGIAKGCQKLQVSMLGGHPHPEAPEGQPALSVAVLGHAHKLLRSHLAADGDDLLLSVDLYGHCC